MTTLTLHNVAQRDDGVFECGVESEDGGKFETIRLRVLGFFALQFPTGSQQAKT